MVLISTVTDLEHDPVSSCHEAGCCHGCTWLHSVGGKERLSRLDGAHGDGAGRGLTAGDGGQGHRHPRHARQRHRHHLRRLHHAACNNASSTPQPPQQQQPRPTCHHGNCIVGVAPVGAGVVIHSLPAAEPRDVGVGRGVHQAVRVRLQDGARVHVVARRLGLLQRADLRLQVGVLVLQILDLILTMDNM